MTWVDFAMLAMIGISVIIGMLRGLTYEILALSSWVAAFFAARFLGPDIAGWWLSNAISDETLRLIFAYVAIFIVTLLLMGLLSHLISGLVKAAKLSTFDRVLGAGFGFGRGVVIVLITTLLAGLTALPREPAWRNSWSGARLAVLADRVKPWLPSALAKHIRYD